MELTGTETRQFFSRMFVMAKKIKELFASTLNGIAASGKCVSSMIVAKFTRLFAAHVDKKTGRNKEP